MALIHNDYAIHKTIFKGEKKVWMISSVKKSQIAPKYSITNGKTITYSGKTWQTSQG